MTTPMRIQLRRRKGWRMPENTIKVDRTTKWGNPFKVWRSDEGWMVSNGSCHWPVPNQSAGMALAVEKFREALAKGLTREIYPGSVLLHELRGKNLACWCPPDSPCHADVLIEVANG